MNIMEEISRGESKTLELKVALPSHENIAKSVIAFSNTSGGKLIIGVSDVKELIGIRDLDIFAIQDRIASIIYDYCYPTIIPEMYIANLNDVLLLVIEVFRGNLLPYYLKREGKNNGTYIRIGATNRKAAYEHIIELERQRRNISYDEEPNYEIDIATLDLTPLQQQFNKIHKQLDEAQLRNLKLLKEEHGNRYPTNALLILLGLVEHAVIKCSRFRGVTRDVFLDKKDYNGNIFHQLEQAEQFITNHIFLRGEIKGLQRVDTYEIPLEALREAMINAVVHRDYTNKGRDIKIGVYDDIVNIVSPGGFPSTLTQADIEYGRSEVRNRVIARVFKELNYIEQWGTGIRRIKSSCLNAGLREPIIEEKGDSVDVVLFRAAPEYAGKLPDIYSGLPDTPTELSDQKKQILNIIREHGKATSRSLEKALSLKERRIRDILKDMTLQGIIQRKGKGRSTYYVA